MICGMPSIRANGLDIGYDVLGAGPPLVMLHGSGSTGSADFAAQLPMFSKAFLAYLPDARGHGRTLWDAADGFTYAMLVDDVLAFVDALGIETFHLLGFSMGAMTALQVASRQPDRIRTLVVIGITTQREPRASVVRQDPGPRPDRARRPALGRGPRPAPRPGPGRGRVASPDARDRTGRRRAAATDAA